MNSMQFWNDLRANIYIMTVFMYGENSFQSESELKQVGSFSTRQHNVTSCHICECRSHCSDISITHKRDYLNI